MEKCEIMHKDEKITLENLQKKIKDNLKEIWDADFYETWIDSFYIEKIDFKEALITYCGDKDIKEFKKQCLKAIKEQVILNCDSVKKIKICPKTEKIQTENNANKKKNIKAFKLLVVSFLCIIMAFAIGLAGLNYVSNREFRETFYNASSLKVNSVVRVIQISDLHSCSFGDNNREIIKRVSKLEPDVIICTGDIVDYEKGITDSVIKLCEGLAKIAPAYFIYGNNEVDSIYNMPLSQQNLDEKFGFKEGKRDPFMLNQVEDEYENILEKTGIKVLKNEMDTIEAGNTKIDIFGILTSNPSSFWTYCGGQFEEYITSNPDHFKITAVHEPYIFEEFEVESWGDLMVCGHTHGGVARVPVLGPLYTEEDGFFPEKSGKYVYGRYDVAGRPLIVSSGLENTNIFRINNQPELVVIDINKF